MTLLSIPNPGTFSFPCSLEHWCDWDRQGVVKALGEPRMEAYIHDKGREYGDGAATISPTHENPFPDVALKVYFVFGE